MRRTLALTLVLAACSSATTDPNPPTTAPAAPSSTAFTTTSLAPSTSTVAPSPTTGSTTSTTGPATTTTTVAARFDPQGATILEMQAAMDRGTLTSVELVQFYLDRIELHEPQINAFVTINPRAIDEALALDVERTSLGARGPLHGIPVVVKDNFDTADMPTTAGSNLLTAFIPPADAFQVARLRSAGAIILGKANMQEWARSVHGNSSVAGRTLNPYDPGRNVGGSSAGTAAAVTVEMAAAGLGTDTCGSIRVPSAYNSIWGIRPTIGLSSRTGVVPLSTSEDTAGPMARSVSDLAVLLDATVGSDPADPITADAAAHIPDSYLDSLDPFALEGARIGVIYSLFGARGPVYRAVEASLDRMAAAGAVIVPVEIPGRTGLIGNATGVFLWEWPFATIDYFQDRPDAPVSSLWDVLASGQYLPETEDQLRRAVSVTTLDHPDYRAAVASRDPLAAAVTATMDDHDLDALAYPSISISPAAVGVTQRGNNCATASVAGLPAISMPAGLTEEGLPVGVELLGRAFQEPTLLGLASSYEAAVDPRVPPDLGG